MREAATIDVSSPAKGLPEAFEGRIRRVWTSPFYLLALFLVAVAMVLLPLLYVGLAVAVGYGVYYHATEHAAIVTGAPGLSARVFAFKAVVLYGGPLLAGIILLVFMVKPLFVRPARREKRISLVPDREPLLFAFVQRLCTAIRAPVPKRIDVDCAINAAAGFRRGLLSLVLPGDLILTLGVPLVAGLTVRQFAGVLAHEFGHFAQGLGMRLSYVIMTVNAWFARVVYERDAWDAGLEELSQSEENGWIRLVFLLARFCVWLTRRILWVLMVLGHVLSCAMMRQMEFDADRHEARLAGSDAFAETVHRLSLLNVAAQAVQRDIAMTWQDGCLPDNLPVVLAARADDAPPAVLAAVGEMVAQGRTRLFDTHPGDAARLRHAARENAPGIFHADGPASALFSNFEGLCQAVTLDYYQETIGPRITPANLVSTAELMKRRQEAQLSRAAAERYFGGCLTIVRPLRLDPFAAGLKAGPRQALQQLQRARAALRKAGPLINESYRQYGAADETLSLTRAYEELAKAGLELNPQQIGLKSTSAGGVAEERVSAQRTIQRMQEQLGKIETVVCLRLESALALLAVPELAARLPQADALHQRSKVLLDALARLHDLAVLLTRLRSQQPALRGLAHLLGTDPQLWADTLRRPVERLAAAQYATLLDARPFLDHQAYPFPHANGPQTLHEFAIGHLPDRDDPYAVIAVVDRVLDRLDSLYQRIMGELAQVAEAIEAVLPAPPPPSDREAK